MATPLARWLNGNKTFEKENAEIESRIGPVKIKDVDISRLFWHRKIKGVVIFLGFPLSMC